METVIPIRRLFDDLSFFCQKDNPKGWVLVSPPSPGEVRQYLKQGHLRRVILQQLQIDMVSALTAIKWKDHV